jgi:hypothetical protein
MGGFVAEQYPWLMENINIIFWLMVLVLLAPVIPYLFLILLSIILYIKDSFFSKKEKLNGVWKNA